MFGWPISEKSENIPLCSVVMAFLSVRLFYCAETSLSQICHECSRLIHTLNTVILGAVTSDLLTLKASPAPGMALFNESTLSDQIYRRVTSHFSRIVLEKDGALN